MILDFTVRIETNQDAAEFEKTNADMVALYKSFETAPSEADKQDGLELLLNVLESIGPKEEYTVRTFATIQR